MADRFNLHRLLLGGPAGQCFHNEIVALAQVVGIGRRVHRLGYVPDPERYYDAVDLPISPYHGAESFGLSVVEAMVAGKPVLVPALGGPAETVVDGVIGWHMLEATAESFRAGLLRALADRRQWAGMGAGGRGRAAECFSLEREARQYLEIVRKTLR